MHPKIAEQIDKDSSYKTKEYDSAEAFLSWGWWDEAACLILDVRLPAMGGLELQHYLADQQPGRPIVFISGRATENEQTWGMLKGAVAFLTKPFSDEALLYAVRKAIAQGQAAFNTTPPFNVIRPSHHESAKAVEGNPERNEKEEPCSHCRKSCAARGCTMRSSTGHVSPLNKQSNG